MVARSVVSTHQGVLESTSPRWLMMPEVPVLAAWTTSRRFSMARRRAKLKCCR